MTYTVVQWGTGAQGVESLRTIIDSPHLELVGVKVFFDHKVGVDAGVLAGRDPIGILATADIDDVIATGADCVAYMPRTTSVDDVCRLLSAGLNVVTTAFMFHPDRIAEDDRRRVADACVRGTTSIHGTGLNPGNLTAVLPLALSGLNRRISRISISERADWSYYESTGITFDNMCFGRPVDEITPTATEFLEFNSGIFVEEVWLIADALGAGIDEVTVEVEAVAARDDHEIFGIRLAAGTTAGQRWSWVGRRDGEPLVEIETLWTVGNEYPDHWPRPEHGWTVTIEGEPSIRAHVMTLASFERSVPIAEHVNSASVATMAAALNAIPAVCAAPAGFATMASLPQVHSAIGFGNR